MAVTVGTANIDINANLQPLVGGITKAKQVTEEFTEKAKSGWVVAAAKITAVSVAISAVSKQLQDLTAPGQTAMESLQRGLIKVSEQSTLLRVGLLGIRGAFAASVASFATAAALSTAAGAVVVYGLRTLTSAVAEQYRAIQEAKEEARLYEEQLKALKDVIIGLRGVTGGVITPFALQYGTQGDIRPEALAASGDILKELTKRMGDSQRASQALAMALRDPTRAFEALRLSGIAFTEQQLEMFRNVQTVNDRLEAQAVIIRELQSQLSGNTAAATSGWQDLTAALADFIDRFLSIKFDPLKDLAEWATRVYQNFAQWSGLNAVFDWFDQRMKEIGATIKQAAKDWFPAAGLETFEAYERQIESMRASIRELQQGLMNATPANMQYFLDQLDQWGPVAERSIRRIINSTEYQTAQIAALGEAYRNADVQLQAYLRSLENQRAAFLGSLTPLRQQLALLQQTNSAMEEQARQHLAPHGMTPGTPEYEQALRTVLDLMGKIADERARINRTTPFDQELRALTQVLIDSEAAAKRLNDAMRELPATLAAGTRELEQRLALLRASANRPDATARMQLEALVQQGLLIQGSEQYNQTLAQRRALLRSIEMEERRLSGKLSVFERENHMLTQQIQLHRYTNEEMAIQNRLLQIRTAAIQAQQPLTEQQAAVLEQRLRQLRDIQQLTGVINDSFSAAFNSMANALTEFAVTGKFKMKDFADEIIRQLLRIAIQATIVRPILNAITGFTNSMVSSTVAPGSTTSAISTTGKGTSLGSFASGGEFVVPGRNRSDQPYLIGLSGGERVNVTPSGQEASGRGVTVINNVQSSKDFDVQTSERQGADGQRIIEQTFTEVMKRIGRGDGDTMFGARFGIRPRTAQR